MPRARSLESYSSANRSQIGICHLCCCCAGWRFFQQNKTIIRLLAEKIWWLGYLACWQYLLVVWTSCRRNFEIQSRCVRRPCQCHCRAAVSLTKQLFASFGRFCKYSKDLKWKYRELSGACLEFKWPLLRCRECPLPPSTPCFSLHHCTLHLLRHCTCFAFHCSSSALHQHC